MTTEPKFVPNQAMSVHVAEGLDVNIRLVDCVGYTVPGAKGYEDENENDQYTLVRRTDSLS